MEDIKKSIKSIESLLNVPFYYKNGMKTGGGKSYSMLVVLRNELYKSSWEKMRKDLNARLTDRENKYIFKLHSRIKEDLKRIDLLEETEKTEPNLVKILEAYHYGKG